mmetsp:Transcript_18720/g.54292  ORF Transcript_18720/g.54292 Transcript_18720/m.54292 type:complete len:222 (-) Transcript_18720:1263-1928(-)
MQCTHGVLKFNCQHPRKLKTAWMIGVTNSESAVLQVKVDHAEWPTLVGQEDARGHFSVITDTPVHSASSMSERLGTLSSGPTWCATRSSRRLVATSSGNSASRTLATSRAARKRAPWKASRVCSYICASLRCLEVTKSAGTPPGRHQACSEVSEWVASVPSPRLEIERHSDTVDLWMASRAAVDERLQKKARALAEGPAPLTVLPGVRLRPAAGASWPMTS